MNFKNFKMSFLKVRICEFQVNDYFVNNPKLGKVIFLPFEHLAEKTTFEKVIKILFYFIQLF